ncbi:MAG: tripartite tricarboxylate transporter TctB family protein, partial [Pseudomonadota bacterium]|nr:tripartite tricarboxylate transporter TctB family protein [Pseudomonadota bacterium]
VVAFVLLGEECGLGPASFACVFIAAFGDRSATVRGSLLLALAAVAIAAVVFSWALKFQLPLLRW